MGSTKKDNKYPNNPTFQLAPENKNSVAATLNVTKPLYFEIANSVHGIGQDIVGEGKDEKIIVIELCKWKMPPHVKKVDCEPVPCPPPVVIP